MALGGSYAAVATDIGGLNADPGAVALLKRPVIQGSQYNYVAGTTWSLGADRDPFGGGSRQPIHFQIGTFGFLSQPGLHGEPAGRHQGLLLRQRDVHRDDAGEELLKDSRFSIGIRQGDHRQPG